MLIVETRLKAFAGDLSKVSAIKASLQQFLAGNATTDFLFNHFNLSKHAFLLLFGTLQLALNVIMLPGTINTVFCNQRSSLDDFFLICNTFTKLV